MKFLKKFATRAEYEAYMADNMENYPHVGYIADEGAVEYVKERKEDLTQLPMFFEAIEDMTATYKGSALQYSLDNETWVDLPQKTATPTITAGQRVYFRGTIPAAQIGRAHNFATTGKYRAKGNIMSLIYNDEFVGKNTINKESQFSSLFSYDTNLIEAIDLHMPATTLAPYCYSAMFENCTNLINGPTLPNATPVSGCYNVLYHGCSNMSYIKAMFTVPPSSDYLYNWVDGVGATGTFVKNAAATWTDSFGTSAIPTGWTVETATE